MNNILFKLKGKLELCQCKKCYGKAYQTIIKDKNKKINVCEAHLEKINRGVKLSEISLIK